MARLITCLLVAFSFSTPVQAGNEQVADALRIALPLAAAGTSLYKQDYQGTKQFAYSFVASSATTLALKAMVDSERPNGEDQDSFPSGHATNAFSAAAFLQTRYGWQYGVPAYLAASWTAASRVQTDHHRWGDVVAGAAIGVAFNYWLVDPYQEQHLVLAPLVSRQQVGVAVSGRF